MRKAQKQQAEGFAKLLDRAHNEIKKAIDRKDPDTARELLEQCQEGAIELGNMIEEEEGEGFVTVSLLETYCEQLYQIHETILHGAAVSGGRIYKSLRRMLVQIENSIGNDIKVRQEIVFLPYKASMWDSLESVWKAAKEDPDCDAYVIPIPYYDKNPDGSFREMHYEGELYPDYVPVTWYEDYDFAERRPDKIFIHNPYDECNYVTSVHPFFYARNIKQFTETLVYIPYFILSEIDPENKEAVKNMAHFCTVPGVIYADKVIVQSEKMRQIYIDVMTGFTAGGITDRGITGSGEALSEKAGERGRRKYWEEKILGLGSPKVDKVLNTRKEDLKIPGEWLQVIEKPDGSWKKIVFYNTSVTALLEHGEKMLLKMRDVFLVFEKNKEEVALLWRPHPLIQATIESMRPKLWEEYEGIVKEYKAAGWGIYDDTADVDRAVVLSDGYYGDGSSVVELYNSLEKPRMLQCCDSKCTKNENKWMPDITRSTFFMNKLFFPASNYNSFWRVDVITGNIELISKFPEDTIGCSNLVSSLVKHNNFIVIGPCLGKNIYLYDYNKNDIFALKIERLKNKSFSLHKIYNDGDFFCFVPVFGTTLGMLKKDMSGIDYEIDFQKLYESETNTKYIMASDSGIYVYNECLYFATMEQGFLIKLNLKKHQVSFVRIDGTTTGFYKILGHKNVVFLLNHDNEIISFDLNKEENISILTVDDLKLDKGIYRDGFYWGKFLYFVSYLSNKCIKLNPENNHIVCTTLEKEWEIKIEDGEEYRFTSVDNKKAIYFLSNKYSLIQIESGKRGYLKMGLQFDEKMIKNYLDKEIEKSMSTNYFLQEAESFYHLEDFLELINRNRKEKSSKRNEMVGNVIFKMLY